MLRGELPDWTHQEGHQAHHQARGGVHGQEPVAQQPQVWKHVHGAEIVSVSVEDLPDGFKGAVSFVQAEDLRMLATGMKQMSSFFNLLLMITGSCWTSLSILLRNMCWEHVETDKQFLKFGAVETKEDQYQHYLYLGTILPDQFSPTCQVLAEKGRKII
jgi:hypothetical protein